MSLTQKQILFCQEYIVDLNATAAARRAGYSEKTAYSIGHENLTKPEINEKVQYFMDLRAKRTEITADRVLVELAKIAFADVRSIFDDGNKLKSPSEIDDDTAAAIQSVKVATRQDGGEVLNFHEIKLSDKRAALEALGKNLKIFTDKIEHDVSDDFKSFLIEIDGKDVGLPDGDKN